MMMHQNPKLLVVLASRFETLDGATYRLDFVEAKNPIFVNE